MNFIKFTLPFPPSVNHYWSSFRGRVMVSKRGKLYRSAALEAIHDQAVPIEQIGGPLKVELVAFPPDRRRRDLDNLQKALLDSVVAAGVIEDDSHIDDLRVVRGAVFPGGKVEVVIRPFTSETKFTTRRGSEP